MYHVEQSKHRVLFGNDLTAKDCVKN